MSESATTAATATATSNQEEEFALPIGVSYQDPLDPTQNRGRIVAKPEDVIAFKEALLRAGQACGFLKKDRQDLKGIDAIKLLKAVMDKEKASYIGYISVADKETILEFAKKSMKFASKKIAETATGELANIYNNHANIALAVGGETRETMLNALDARLTECKSIKEVGKFVKKYPQYSFLEEGDHKARWNVQKLFNAREVNESFLLEGSDPKVKNPTNNSLVGLAIRQMVLQERIEKGNLPDHIIKAYVAADPEILRKKIPETGLLPIEIAALSGRDDLVSAMLNTTKFSRSDGTYLIKNCVKRATEAQEALYGKKNKDGLYDYERDEKGQLTTNLISLKRAEQELKLAQNLEAIRIFMAKDFPMPEKHDRIDTGTTLSQVQKLSFGERVIGISTKKRLAPEVEQELNSVSKASLSFYKRADIVTRKLERASHVVTKRVGPAFQFIQGFAEGLAGVAIGTAGAAVDVTVKGGVGLMAAAPHLAVIPVKAIGEGLAVLATGATGLTGLAGGALYGGFSTVEAGFRAVGHIAAQGVRLAVKGAMGDDLRQMDQVFTRMKKYNVDKEKLYQEARSIYWNPNTKESDRSSELEKMKNYLTDFYASDANKLAGEALIKAVNDKLSLEIKIFNGTARLMDASINTAYENFTKGEFYTTQVFKPAYDLVKNHVWNNIPKMGGIWNSAFKETGVGMYNAAQINNPVSQAAYSAAGSLMEKGGHDMSLRSRVDIDQRKDEIKDGTKGVRHMVGGIARSLKEAGAKVNSDYNWNLSTPDARDKRKSKEGRVV